MVVWSEDPNQLGTQSGPIIVSDTYPTYCYPNTTEMQKKINELEIEVRSIKETVKSLQESLNSYNLVIKDLDYYMSLPYKIEIIPILPEHGGGFCACLPELGRYALVGDGETIEEALKNLEECKRERLAAYIKEGLEIPEPDMEKA